MSHRGIGLLLLLALATLPVKGVAQSAPDKDAQAVINAQFGAQYVLLPGFPILTGDFNGDGSEDALFVVTLHGALQVADERFHVLDPSSEYFGIGDPKITSQFASPYPGGPRYVLILHGDGKDGWHAKQPKDRFVLINMTFDKLSVGHVLKKKKTLDDINLEETGILNSFLYWNGHKYLWQPGADL